MLSGHAQATRDHHPGRPARALRRPSAGPSPARPGRRAPPRRRAVVMTMGALHAGHLELVRGAPSAWPTRWS